MDAVILALGSVVLVSLISLVGLATLSLKENLLRKILLYLVSFSTGALLGDAFIHLLPEATEAGFTLNISLYILSGILVSFVIEKFIHWRHCHGIEDSGHFVKTGGELVHKATKHTHPFVWMNLFGDGVHNFIDGLIIAAAYVANIPLGIATTLAIIFHEIPQEIGDFGILLHGGLKKMQALKYNFLTAIAAVIGTVIGLAFAGSIPGIKEFLLPFAAGNFIYIAGSDLIPELHKETKPVRSVLELLAFVLGILVMLSLLVLE